MSELTPTEREQFERLVTIFRHATAEHSEGVYFICGESGNKDDNGLPESIMVCPSYGSDHVEIYRKVARNES